MSRKIIIYQLNKDIPENRKIIFMPYRHAVESGIDLIEHFDSLYDKIYETVIDNSGDDMAVLDAIFAEYNRKPPEDFKGHSISMSDVISIAGRKYYCDAIGWKALMKESE